jgi:hypothetical protein
MKSFCCTLQTSQISGVKIVLFRYYQPKIKNVILYCCTYHLRQSFTVLRATPRFTNLITFLQVYKFLKYTTCFGQHGHYQVLKICLMRKSLLSLVADAYAGPSNARVCNMCEFSFRICVCEVFYVWCCYSFVYSTTQVK